MICTEPLSHEREKIEKKLAKLIRFHDTASYREIMANRNLPTFSKVGVDLSNCVDSENHTYSVIFTTNPTANGIVFEAEAYTNDTVQGQRGKVSYQTRTVRAKTKEGLVLRSMSFQGPVFIEVFDAIERMRDALENNEA